LRRWPVKTRSWRTAPNGQPAIENDFMASLISSSLRTRSRRVSGDGAFRPSVGLRSMIPRPTAQRHIARNWLNTLFAWIGEPRSMISSSRS
jgi:hypothetical protein